MRPGVKVKGFPAERAWRKCIVPVCNTLLSDGLIHPVERIQNRQRSAVENPRGVHSRGREVPFYAHLPSFAQLPRR